jgi:teichuronic acid biosynthesis glycosyltransferase TuaC
MSSSRKRLRIGVVTPFFPIEEEPYRGHSAYQVLRRLTAHADIKVFCPLTIYPEALKPRSYRYHRTNLNFTLPDIQTEYFEYSVLPVVSRPVNGYLCRRKLLPRLRRFQPDLLLNYWLYPEGFATVLCGRDLKVPVIVRSIGSDIRRIPDRATRHFTVRTLKEADYVLTASTELRERAIDLGARPEACKAILNGCDTTIFYPRDREQMRSQLGIARDAEVAVFVGSILESKGMRELLDAVRILAASRPNFAVYAIGIGPFTTELREKIQVAGLQDRFHLLGRKSASEVAEWMSAADLFCLPSHSEGCPNVIIEALACGCPVVATDVGGIPELITAGSGTMVPARDAGKLAAALDAALAGNNWDRQAISRLHRQSWEQVADTFLDICQRAVHDKRRV